MFFGSFLYKENKNFPFRNPLVNVATSILLLASSIKGFLVEVGYVRPQPLVLSLLDAPQTCSRLLIHVPLDKMRGKLRAQLLEGIDGVGRQSIEPYPCETL